MNTYIQHKILSIGIVLALSLIGLLWFPNDQVQRWYFLLLATTIFGYSHYLIGGFYQLKSFRRKTSPVRHYSVFGTILLLSLAICALFYVTGNIVLFAFVTIGYFMLHGFFNEITLYERQSGGVASRLTILAVVLGFSGLILNAVGHASWFFTPELRFVTFSPEVLAHYIDTHPLPIIARFLGIGSIVAAIAVEFVALRRAASHQRAHLAFLVLLGSGLFVTIFMHPLHYVFLLSGYLLYHFLVWFLFFYKQFRERDRQQFVTYLGIHALVVLPFIFLMTDTAAATFVDTYLLNSYTFLTLTMVHISTSFMSELWFQRVFLKA